MRIAVTLLVLVLAMGSPLSAAAATSTSSTASSYLKGTLLYEDGGVPLRKTLVNLYSTSSPEDPYVSDLTDRSGHYSFSPADLPKGHYFLQAPAHDGVHLATAGDTFPLNPRSRVTKNLRLDRGAEISGHVDGPDGGGAGELHAEISLLEDGADEPTIAYNSTDFDGNYRFQGITPGKYKIEVRPCVHCGFGAGLAAERYWGDVDNRRSAPLLTIGPKSVHTGIDVHLVKGSVITGILSDADQPGIPLVGVRVNAYVADDLGETFYQNNDRTDRDGRFSIPGLAADQYTLSLKPTDNKHVPGFYGGGLSNAKAARITLDPSSTFDASTAIAVGGSISGRVSGPESLSGEAVEAYRYDEDQHIWNFFAAASLPSTASDSETYVIGGLPSGSYRVAFTDYSSIHGYGTDYFGGEATFGGATAVTVTAPDPVRNVDATLTGHLHRTPVPIISGATTVGSRLLVETGTWSPDALHFDYQWQRTGKPIPGATKAAYRLTKADKGKAISVKVTGSKTGYVSAAKTSKAVRAK